jgi:Protein of unknwon function (DUF3310)
MEKTNTVTQTFRGDVSITSNNPELKASPKYFWKNSDGSNVMDGSVFKTNDVVNIVSNDDTIVIPFDMSVTTKSATGVGSSLLTGDTLVTDKKLPKKKKLKKSEIKKMRDSIQNAIKSDDKFSTVSDDVYTESHLALAKDLLQKADNKIMSDLLQKSGTFPKNDSSNWNKSVKGYEKVVNENSEKLLTKIELDSIPPNSVCTVRNGQKGWEVVEPITEEKLLQKDDVNHPKHYNSDVFPQVIDMMLKTFSKIEVLAFCKLNSFKYRMRAGIKDSNKIEEDIKKAIWYENKFSELNNAKQIIKG